MNLHSATRAIVAYAGIIPGLPYASAVKDFQIAYNAEFLGVPSARMLPVDGRFGMRTSNAVQDTIAFFAQQGNWPGAPSFDGEAEKIEESIEALLHKWEAALGTKLSGIAGEPRRENPMTGGRAARSSRFAAESLFGADKPTSIATV